METRETCPAVCQSEGGSLLLTLIRQGLQDRDGLLSEPEHMHEHKHKHTCVIVGLPTHKQTRTVETGVTQRGSGYCPARFNNELYAEHIKFCLCSISTAWMQRIRTGYPATTGLPFSFHAIKKSLFLIVLQFAAEVFKYVSGGMTNIITSYHHREEVTGRTQVLSSVLNSSESLTIHAPSTRLDAVSQS